MEQKVFIYRAVVLIASTEPFTPDEVERLLDRRRTLSMPELHWVDARYVGETLVEVRPAPPTTNPWVPAYDAWHDTHFPKPEHFDNDARFTVSQERR